MSNSENKQDQDRNDLLEKLRLRISPEVLDLSRDLNCAEEFIRTSDATMDQKTELLFMRRRLKKMFSPADRTENKVEELRRDFERFRAAFPLLSHRDDLMNVANQLDLPNCDLNELKTSQPEQYQKLIALIKKVPLNNVLNKTTKFRDPLYQQLRCREKELQELTKTKRPSEFDFIPRDYLEIPSPEIMRERDKRMIAEEMRLNQELQEVRKQIERFDVGLPIDLDI